MSGLTGNIERFLKEMLKESEGHIEIGRNDLAERFGCAPSQINYVLSTRFTPYKGYCIESRRGGSGYIRIIKLAREPEETVEKILENTISDSITKDRARSIIDSLLDEGIINKRECLIIRHATDDQAIADVPMDFRNKIRAQILKNILVVFLR